jgi:hypothetical protein
MQVNMTPKPDSEVIDFKRNPSKSSPWLLSVAPMLDWTRKIRISL